MISQNAIHALASIVSETDLAALRLACERFEDARIELTIAQAEAAKILVRLGRGAPDRNAFELALSVK